MISNNFNEIRTSVLSGTFIESIIPYIHLNYNVFTDDYTTFTLIMNRNEKIRAAFQRDYHGKKLYLNLWKQESMVSATDTLCKVAEVTNDYVGPT